MLALRHFAEIIASVLRALILVIGVHPLTGILRRSGAPVWLAATVALITLVIVIFGLAASLALSVADWPPSSRPIRTVHGRLATVR